MTDSRDDGPVVTAKKNPDELTAATIPQSQGSSALARAVTINKPVAEVYAYFRDFSNLPSFMENVVSIDTPDATRSHWVVKAPGGTTVEWDARVTEDQPNALIAWTSACPSGSSSTQDAVMFGPSGRAMWSSSGLCRSR